MQGNRKVTSGKWTNINTNTKTFLVLFLLLPRPLHCTLLTFDPSCLPAAIYLPAHTDQSKDLDLLLVALELMFSLPGGMRRSRPLCPASRSPRQLRSAARRYRPHSHAATTLDLLPVGTLQHISLKCFPETPRAKRFDSPALLSGNLLIQ